MKQIKLEHPLEMLQPLLQHYEFTIIEDGQALTVTDEVSGGNAFVLNSEPNAQAIKDGAVDSMQIPFDIDELVIRLNNQFDNITYEGITVNETDRTIEADGQVIDLTNNEFKLLVYFIENKGRTVTKEEIAENVWDITFDTKTNYINVYISYLRSKLEDLTGLTHIETIRGKGFKLP